MVKNVARVGRTINQRRRSIELIGPGIAAISMAFRPDGAVFYAGRDLAGLLPWRRDAREEKRLAVAQQREQDIGRDEIGELGLERPFTEEKVAQLDRVLGISDELALRPNSEANGNGHAGRNGVELTEGVLDGTAVR